MAAQYGTVSVGVAAVQIRPSSGLRDTLFIENVHATQDLFIGSDSSVLTTTGFKLIAGDSVLLRSRTAVFGIASGAATDVRWSESSV